MKTDPKITAARAFVRSLNILLKFARLYGFEHGRTTDQLETAWREIRAAIPLGDEAGLLLGATGSQLLLDGVPIEGSLAERQFAQLLSAAGLASVHFFPAITQEELGRFARAFPSGKSKPAELGQQLKAALTGSSGIRINEICFVATDSRLQEAAVAAQLTASTLGGDNSQFKEWLNDPQKLLELIAAAQGSRSGSGGVSGSAPGVSGNAPGRGPAGGGEGTIQAGEEDLLGIMRVLTSIGQLSGGTGDGVAAGPFQEHLSTLPGRAQDIVRQALASLAAQAPEGKPDQAVLVRLAEHLAIRFALERYESGEVKVNAVRQLLDRMNQEIENLHKILGAHEDKMTEAGLVVETHGDLLDRQFWAAVPESSKRAVLISAEAWCIPPRNVRQFVAQLIERGDMAEAYAILRNYAGCANCEEADARRKTASGLAELAELYANGGPELLSDAIRRVGLQLSLERDADLQALVGAAFVRLTQEAASQRCYRAIQQALDLLDRVENQRPAVAQALRPKIGVEERIPEYIDEALRAKKIAVSLAGILRQLPRTATEQLSTRFNRAALCEDCDHIAALAHELGAAGIAQLRGTLRGGPIAEAMETVGLLSRLEPAVVEQFLPPRMKDCPRTVQDRIVRQIAASGAKARSRLLLAIFDHLDPLIMPLALDEIGMAGNRDALGRLLCIADGDLPQSAEPFVRLKAVEALGRLGCAEAAGALRRIVEAKQMWRWVQPHELRVAAAQVLQKMDPEWAQDFLPRSSIDAAELAVVPLDAAQDCRWVRQRRYARIRLRKPLSAVSTNLRENCRLEIKTVSLSGGVATIDRHLQPGTQVTLRLQSSLRGLRATALMRDYRAQDMAFEFVDMDLEERGRLRRLLAENSSAIVPPAAEAEPPAVVASH